MDIQDVNGLRRTRGLVVDSEERMWSMERLEQSGATSIRLMRRTGLGAMVVET